MTSPLPAPIGRTEAGTAAKSDFDSWHEGSGPPPIKRGEQKEFIVAVRRARSGKVYSFAASYLNAYPLEYRDGCPKGEGCSGEGCDDGCPTTGWFLQVGDDCDGAMFHDLELRDGDEFLGWREVPQWPTQ